MFRTRITTGEPNSDPNHNPNPNNNNAHRDGGEGGRPSHAILHRNPNRLPNHNHNHNPNPTHTHNPDPLLPTPYSGVGSRGLGATPYFYSDSHNDLPLLRLVDHPVAVDPDPLLRAEAEAQRWKILSLR